MNPPFAFLDLHPLALLFGVVYAIYLLAKHLRGES
jgi:hypothetical protein